MVDNRRMGLTAAVGQSGVGRRQCYLAHGFHPDAVVMAVKPDQSLPSGIRSISAGVDFDHAISWTARGFIQRMLEVFTRINVEPVGTPSASGPDGAGKTQAKGKHHSG